MAILVGHRMNGLIKRALYSIALALSVFQTVVAQRSISRDLVVRDSLEFDWSENGDWLSYGVNAESGVMEYFKVDLSTGTRAPVFDQNRLQEALSQTLDEDISPSSMKRIRDVELNENGKDFRFRLRDRHFSCDANYELTEVEEDRSESSQWLTRSRRSTSTGEESGLIFVNETEQELVCYWLDLSGSSRRYESLAPGERFEQHTFEGHVWSLRTETGRELVRIKAPDRIVTLVIDTELLQEFEELPSRSERSSRTRPPASSIAMVRDNNIWLRGEPDIQLTSDGTAKNRYDRRLVESRSGRYLATTQVKVAERRIVHTVESSPRDQVQPKLHEMSYTKPGDSIDQAQIRIFDLESHEPIPIDHELMTNPWSISRLMWLPSSDHLLCLYNQRGHQLMRVLSIDAQTGDVQALIEENSETFIDYAHKTYLKVIRSGTEILWASERSGFNHLYRFDAHGELLNAVTQGEWVVRDIIEVDEEGGTVLFAASGLVAGEDPYYQHLCRVNLDGTNFLRLTSGDGDHRWQFSPNRRWLIDQYSRVDQPLVSVLRDAESGELVCELEQADCEELVRNGWSLPEPFHAKGRDGETEIYGVIVRPTNFQPGVKYPVVEKIYAGPHSAHVPKSFGLMRQEHEIADLGFIVVRIDGMGTSHRGKKFHDVCWKNLADAGFHDRIAWMKAAAATRPEMDLERVGIFGGSAGGQNAMRALLDHHDFYDVAVADCGCHDNRMDKIWWNEAWMGWPIDESYAKSSNVEDADKLQGELLLIVGELDRNVDPASTMQVVDALVRANKDFDLLIMPGVGHGAAETPYASRRRSQFLVEHLLGK